MVVYEDAQLAVLGVFIGDTLVSWILIRVGSGSAISSHRVICKRVAALASTQGLFVAWAYSIKTFDIVSCLVWITLKVESRTIILLLLITCPPPVCLSRGL